MPIQNERFTSMCNEYGISLTPEQTNHFSMYADTLVEWNEKVNLTAITDMEEIEVKHFLDSLLLLDALDAKDGATLIDVGTGAGFPAVPCGIMRSDLKLTLLDSLKKRLTFLEEVCNDMSMNVTCVHDRAEDGAHKKQHREQYDISTARAVAKLRELAEYCLPYVKIGGHFVALKGYDCDEEVEESKGAIAKLGGRLVEVKKYDLPMGNRRAIIVIEKISQTPTHYPRKTHVMAKNPLK